MKRENAEKISKLVNRIKRCEDFLQSLKGHSYNDEFKIYYRGLETCDLEENVLEIIIKHYESEIERLQHELDKL